MSSILKALEKVEESNSTKRVAGDSALIRSRKSRPVWVMPVAVLCGAGVATLATFAAMGGFSRHAPVAQASLVVAKAAPVVVAPLNQVVETPVLAPEQAPPVDPALLIPGSKSAPVANLKGSPVANPKAVAAVNPKAVSRSTGKSAAASAAAVPGSASLQPASVQPAPAQAAPVSQVVPAPAPARPELKVSGIVWQKNGESSFAVVNNRAVQQGGTVDGYKVLEIHHDMVRFSGRDGNVDVPLGDDE